MKTPNPSKAPWYFLGSSGNAGLLRPVVGRGGSSQHHSGRFDGGAVYRLQQAWGNGYYTFKQRSFAVTTFLFGFLPLWVALIVLGTFLRGPNWNFFGIYEYWDVHKVEAANNVNLSEFFWNGLGLGIPKGSGVGDILLARISRNYSDHCLFRSSTTGSWTDSSEKVFCPHGCSSIPCVFESHSLDGGPSDQDVASLGLCLEVHRRDP
jgi:hypothetical protein